VPSGGRWWCRCETAQAVFASPGVTRVDIGLTGGADPAAVTAALESRLTSEPYVLSSPQDLAASLRASTTDFQATTALIAAIALFAGAFLIFNTLSMTVTERIRDVGLLRAAGASRGQVMSFMLTQALALGIVGSLVGLLLGGLLALAMVAFVRTIGSVTLDRPALSLEAVRRRPVGRGRGHARGRPRTSSPREPDPAGRGTQGPPRPARRAGRPAALAGRGLPGHRPGRCGRPAAGRG